MIKKQSSGNDWKAYLTKAQDFLDLYFAKKAPAMPENAKEFIVKISPYLAIVGLLITFSSLSAFFGFTRFASSYYFRPSFSFPMLSSLVSMVLMAIAIPGLFKRTVQAWNLIFYSSLVNLLGSLLSFDLASFLISGLISFYILFQTKSLYKN